VTNTNSSVVNCQGYVGEFHIVWKVGTLYSTSSMPALVLIQVAFHFAVKLYIAADDHLAFASMYFDEGSLKNYVIYNNSKS
jgi:hypothetical protein